MQYLITLRLGKKTGLCQDIYHHPPSRVYSKISHFLVLVSNIYIYIYLLSVNQKTVSCLISNNIHWQTNPQYDIIASQNSLGKGSK